MIDAFVPVIANNSNTLIQPTVDVEPHPVTDEC